MGLSLRQMEPPPPVRPRGPLRRPDREKDYDKTDARREERKANASQESTDLKKWLGGVTFDMDPATRQIAGPLLNPEDLPRRVRAMIGGPLDIKTGWRLKDVPHDQKTVVVIGFASPNFSSMLETFIFLPIVDLSWDNQKKVLKNTLVLPDGNVVNHCGTIENLDPDPVFCSFVREQRRL